MKIIIKPKLGGKTTELIKLADGYNGYIVCKDRMESHRVADNARSLKCHINFPITFDDFLRNQYYGKGIRKFFIDNLDLLLNDMFPVPIEGVTITGEYNKEKKMV